MNSPYYYARHTEQTNIVADLATAINAEYSAIQCYERVANMAKSHEVKLRILEIRKDEIRHFETFSRLYTSLTGEQPTPHITESCPSSFIPALEFALENEQKAVDFYFDIMDRARDQKIKMAFHRASADEQNHAVWFLYYLTKELTRHY